MAIEIGTSTLNVVISILGFFILAYGAISVKIKQKWYLGEALPAVIFGAMLGPLATRWLDARMWGMAIIGQVPAITLGMTRIVIGVQLVIAGFQLPARFLWYRYKEMLICLLPVMTIMWLCTTACVMATIPNLSFLAALVIGSCVTCTDPILSQAVAKGPFSDKYGMSRLRRQGTKLLTGTTVRRPLRELISAEAGANDGFGFPFLMLATYLIRHAESSELTAEIAASEAAVGAESSLAERALQLVARASEGDSETIGRLGGGVGKALANWGVETWLYSILMSAVYGTVVGWGMMYVARFALRKYAPLACRLRAIQLIHLGNGSMASPIFSFPQVSGSSLLAPVACWQRMTY
jgi:sodium/hydrogen antiporter